MKIDELKAFAATAKHLSFKKAAQDLHVSASSISKLVSSLEDRVKKKLFFRSTRDVRLTSDGHLLLPAVYRALDALFDVNELFSEDYEDSLVSGSIRITCPSTLATRRIADLAVKFQAMYPKIEMEYIVTDNRLDLVKNGLDIAIRVMKLPENPVVALKLAENKMIIAGSPTYLKSTPIIKSIEDLTNHRIFLLPQHLDLHFQKSKVTLREVATNAWCKTSNGDFLVEFAKCGAGLVIRPYWGVQREIENGDLSTVDLGDELLTDTGIYAVYHQNRYLPRRIRLWLEHLKANF